MLSTYMVIPTSTGVPAKYNTTHAGPTTSYTRSRTNVPLLPSKSFCEVKLQMIIYRCVKITHTYNNLSSHEKPQEYFVTELSS